MKEPVISLLLPTRGRPALVERFFGSVVAHTDCIDDIEVILYIDDDDIGSHHLDSEKLFVNRIVGPRISMGGYNSACYAVAQGRIIILVNDDMVINTPGWDRKIIDLDERISDKIYLAYGNDLFNKKRLCTFPILSRQTCEILQEPYPKEYLGAFIDYHIFDIFKRLQNAGYDRIHYLDDVVFEHLHYRTGKASFDATYQKRGRFADDEIFLSLIGARKKASARLLRFLRGLEWHDMAQEMDDSCQSVGDGRVPKGAMLGTLSGTMMMLARNILLDKSLPLRWRTYLYAWFLGRYMAARGMLRPFAS